MKVLNIINNLSIGGAEKLVVDLIINFQEADIEVDLLVLNNVDTFLEKYLKENNINFHSLKRKSIYSPLVIIDLLSYFHKYDVIHVHLFPCLYWAAFARLISPSKVRLVYSEHSTYNRRRSYYVFKFIEKYIYNIYDKIIAISDKTRDSLCSWLNYSLDTSKIVTINNAINLEVYKSSVPLDRHTLNLKNDSVVILMVARFSEAKDHFTLLKAFEILHRSTQNTHLLLAGDGPLKQSIADYATKLKISDRIVFLGNRSDVPRLIKMSDLCILSSHWEGFGLVAVEYMASGKPVIASDVEGLNEVVSNAGLLFTQGDAMDLSNKMSRLIHDKLYYQSIAKRCLERAGNYDIKYLIKSHISIYKNE